MRLLAIGEIRYNIGALWCSTAIILCGLQQVKHTQAQTCSFDLNDVTLLLDASTQLSTGVECAASIVQTGSVAVNVPLTQIFNYTSSSVSNSSSIAKSDSSSIANTDSSLVSTSSTSTSTSVQGSEILPDLVKTPGGLFVAGMRLRPPQMTSASTNVLQVHSDHDGAITVSVWVFWPHLDHPKRAQTLFSSSDFDSKNATNFQFGLTSPDSQQRYSQLCAGSTLLRTRNAFETNQGCSTQKLPTRQWVWIAVSINAENILSAYVNAQKVFQVRSFGGAPRYESTKRNNGAAFQLGALFNTEQTAFAGLVRDFQVHKTELSPQELTELYTQKVSQPERVMNSSDSVARDEFASVDGYVRQAQLYASLVGTFGVDQSSQRQPLQGYWESIETPNEALSEGAVLQSSLDCSACAISMPNPSASNTDIDAYAYGAIASDNLFVRGYSKSLWVRLMREPGDADPEFIQLASNFDTTPELYRNIRLYEFQQHRVEMLRDTRVCAWHDSGVNSELDGVSDNSQLRVCTEPLVRTYLQTWVHLGVSFDYATRSLAVFLNAQPMSSVRDTCQDSGMSVITARQDFNKQTCFEQSALGLTCMASDVLLVRDIALRDAASSQFEFAAQMLQQSQNQ